jgi:two-component sensor histidine kinase
MRQQIQPGGGAATDPIPEPAAIQPHGALLVIDTEGCIGSLAGATGRVFGRAPHELLGRPLAEISVPPGRPLPVMPPDLASQPRHLGTWHDRHDVRWDVWAHRRAPYTLLEFEPAAEDGPPAATIAALHRAFAGLESGAGLQAACAACATALRQLSGYDRVVVGRRAGTAATTLALDEAIPGLLPWPDDATPLPFAPDGDGQVHAVPDLAALPARLLPARNDGGGPDLGGCVLRAIGARQRAHLEHLGVAASLWLPIVVRGRPWGAVACHHSIPRRLPCALRLACEIVVRELALRIETCESDERQRQAGLLVQEAHHRVHNSLHLLAAMLRLQARQAAGADVRLELEAAAGRLGAVSTVHRQLSRPEGAHEVRLDAYLAQLCTELARSWSDAWVDQLTVDACEVSLAADSVVSLGLVVTELLTNAAKYAYRGAPGPIDVQARVHGAWLHVIVSDRGCGMHGEGAGTGLGSTLNRLFAAQFGGDIQLSSGEGGTTATVRVPLLPSRQDAAAGALAGTG